MIGPPLSPIDYAAEVMASVERELGWTTTNNERIRAVPLHLWREVVYQMEREQREARING